MTEHLIGVISDTHGLLRPEAVKALEGVELIIHAGDIGDPRLLRQLERLAPVHAVRGNTDRGDWAADLPRTRVVEVGGVHLYVLHELFTLDLDPAAAGSPRSSSATPIPPTWNTKTASSSSTPAAPDPRRFTLPVTLARIQVQDNGLFPEFIDLVK